MPKELNGRELAGFIKERQAGRVKTLRSEKIFPRLLILRDSKDPVIEKYVSLKKHYGEDIGVPVSDVVVESPTELSEAIRSANSDDSVSALIVQLPLKTLVSTSPEEKKLALDALLGEISPEKDVDGLSGHGRFDSATATAINWLLAGYDIPLAGKKIALVGRGRLVGAPLFKMFKNSGLDVSLFHRGSNLEELKSFDVIISATGVPGLLKSAFIKPGATVVDAGTASEDGVLKGDLEESARSRSDLLALTPKIGGVGPLTVSVLFENVLVAAESLKTSKPPRSKEPFVRKLSL